MFVLFSHFELFKTQNEPFINSFLFLSLTLKEGQEFMLLLKCAWEAAIKWPSACACAQCVRAFECTCTLCLSGHAVASVHAWEGMCERLGVRVQTVCRF